MIRFIIKVKDNQLTRDYFTACEERFNALIKTRAFITSYRQTIALNRQDINNLYVINDFELLPPIYLFFLVATAGIALIFGVSAWLLIPGLLSLTGIFWQSFFFKFMIKKGLRKAGYKDDINFISKDELINGAIIY